MDNVACKSSTPSSSVGRLKFDFHTAIHKGIVVGHVRVVAAHQSQFDVRRPRADHFKYVRGQRLAPGAAAPQYLLDVRARRALFSPLRERARRHGPI